MMFELKRSVNVLVAEEGQRAGAKFGPIANAMEGFGVLAEEVQEFTEVAHSFMGQNEFGIENLLLSVRHSAPDGMIRKLMNMKRSAIYAACEAIQVAAVCGRFVDAYDREVKKHGHALEGDGQ